jgi:cytochrome c oxidase subunit 2
VKPNRFASFLIAGAVFIAIGIFIGLAVRVFPVQASAEAQSIDALFNLMLAIAVVVFLIVEGGIIYSIVRFRRRAGDETDGAYIHGNTALEITWTAIPAIIVFALSIFSYQVFVDLRTPTEGEIPVGVVGRQFNWLFTYEMPPDESTTPELRAQIATYMNDSMLVLPVNRAIRAEIRSEDVIHSFYIPEFRIKQDATPGRTSMAYFTPTQTGEWWVVCTELCGVGHAAMSQINRLKVVEQAEYDRYIADLYQKAKETASDPTTAAVGKVLIAQKYACGACHILDDAGLAGNIGPSLNGIADRAAGHAAAGEGLVGGTDAAAYIRGSIVNPNLYLVAGYNAGIMPQNYGNPNVMPKDDLEAIVNYLLTQGENAAAQN